MGNTYQQAVEFSADLFRDPVHGVVRDAHHDHARGLRRAGVVEGYPSLHVRGVHKTEQRRGVPDFQHFLEVLRGLLNHGAVRFHRQVPQQVPDEPVPVAVLFAAG